MQKKSVIQRIENKIGKYAVKNLIIYILAAYVIGYVLILTDSRFGLYEYLVMDPAMVMQGQVWRLFTWICSIPQTIGFWVIFMFLFYYWIGRTLEQTLGAFKYNLYMFSGWFFITLGAMVVYWITGVSLDVSTYYLNLASFLAFALLFPNMQVYLFFLIPIKIKWLAFVDIAYLVYRIVTYLIALGNTHTINWSSYPGVSEADYRTMLYAQIFSIVISLLNFIIFFFMVRKITPKNLKEKLKSAQAQRQRQKNWNKNWEESRSHWKENHWQDGETKWGEKRKERVSKYGTPEFEHQCEVCGRTNVTNPELSFRFCSKCEGNHEFCEEHIFNHEHK